MSQAFIRKNDRASVPANVPVYTKDGDKPWAPSETRLAAFNGIIQRTVRGTDDRPGLATFLIDGKEIGVPVAFVTVKNDGKRRRPTKTETRNETAAPSADA